MATKTAAVKVSKTNNGNTNTNTNNTENAAVALNLSAVEIVETAAALIRENGTISAIRSQSATLREKYGPKTWDAILSQCKTIRHTEINNAAAALAENVFTFDGILSAVFAAVAKDGNFAALCKMAKREYNGTDAITARRVIADYYAAVDKDGKPLTKVNYINAAATEIFAVYESRNLTENNAVSILKASLKGMATAIRNKVSNGTDAAAATRNNVKQTGVIVAVYDAANENGRAVRGFRKDTSKDERTKADAAAIIGKGLPVGAVLLSDYNKETDAATENAATNK